jgi:ribose/xylose/arabinose/galactoside ABC-type transport system permease subunit
VTLAPDLIHKSRLRQALIWGRLRLGWSVESTFRLLLVVLLLVVAATTDGIFTTQSMLALVNSAGLVGCVAVGMSFVTFGGHIMSFALSSTVGMATIVCSALSEYGLGIAVVGVLAVGLAMNALQGFIIGYFRANALIVTIAAASLSGGVAEYLTSGQTVYAEGAVLAPLRAKMFGMPSVAYVFVFCLIVAHLILTSSRLGKRVFMLGSNARAAKAAGIRIATVTTATFAMAGLFAACAGVLIAGRYGAGMFDYGADYNYQAIAGVLVGGNSVAGGEGSVWRTALGVFVIALISNVLLLRGFSSEMQLLAAGLVVSLAILLQGRLKR